MKYVQVSNVSSLKISVIFFKRDSNIVNPKKMLRVASTVI